MLRNVAVAALCLGSVSSQLSSQVRPTVAPELKAQCEAIARVSIPHLSITSTTAEAAGTGWAASMQGNRRMPPAAVSQPFCRVQGLIERTIAFELWLPAATAWNGKFLGAGVGGAAGTFNYSDLPRGVSRGYAAATTDTGHKMSDPSWMLDATARDNYTHRANHLLAVKSKAIVEAIYGKKPSRSYFVGCSGGGRQGLKELQLFPTDYDGILTGANGPRTPEMTVRRMWEIKQRDAYPNLMKAADWQLIADAGRKSCDAADGATDNIVEDPRQCRFKVASLTCKPGQSGDCLTPEQVRFAERFYQPLRDEAGRAIDGGLLPGVLVDNGRSQLALGTFGQAIRKSTNWNGEGFEVGKDLAAIDRVMPELRADNPDVSAFRRRGGKLIQYTGWLDGAVAARMVVDYHESLTRSAGGAGKASNFSRLYMLPDVHHCAGGPGADQIGGAGRDAPIVDGRHDLLAALEDWVEKGRAPGEMIASKVEGDAVVRTHLICPYPKQARHVKGPFGRSTSYKCVAPPS